MLDLVASSGEVEIASIEYFLSNVKDKKEVLVCLSRSVTVKRRLHSTLI